MASENGNETLASFPTLLKLKPLLDTSADIVGCNNIDGYYIYTGGAMKFILGYDNEDLAGLKGLDITIPEDREKSIEAGKELRSTGIVTNFESRVFHKSGQIMHISWSMRLIKEEGLILSFGRDISATKAHEQELMKFAKTVSEFLENIPDGFYALTADWKFSYFNHNAEILLQRKKEDLLDKNIWEEFPEAMTHRIFSVYRYAMKNNISGTFDTYYQPLQRWFRINYHPSPQGLSVFFHDVTKDREDEKQRREYVYKITRENDLLSNILESMGQGFITIDDQDIVRFWNKNAEIITTRTADEMIGKTLMEGLNFCQDEELVPRMKASALHPQQSNFEYYSEALSIWLEFNVYKAREGFSIFFRDITERKKTEKEVQRLSEIVKETTNAVIITDKEHHIIWVNAAFEKNTGYTLAEARGKSPQELLHGPETDPKTIQYIHSRLRRGKSFRAEILNYRKNKTKFWSEVYGQAIRDENGEIREYFSLRSDITERKRLQKRIVDQQKLWQEKITEAVIRAQENERAIVSQELHDNVNQVLTTVKLYSELTLSDFSQASKLLPKAVSLLQESIAEIRNLSRRLSAPSLGSIKFDESLYDLVKTLSVASRTAIGIKIYGLQTEMIDAGLHLAIYRILQEHLTNILKHSAACVAKIEVRSEKRKILLRIEDDGIGFNIREKRAGIGITNMIARAENTGGHLEITSSPGHGCILMASFPLRLEKKDSEG